MLDTSLMDIQNRLNIIFDTEDNHDISNFKLDLSLDNIFEDTNKQDKKLTIKVTNLNILTDLEEV
jgi:hypothetical protein